MATNRSNVLKQAWEYAYDKEDWQPPLGMALDGVDEQQADWKPQGEAVNSICENVHHLIFYKERFLKRWHGDHAPGSPGMSNTDTFGAAAIGAEEESWEQTRQRLADVHARIGGIISELDEEGYDREVVKDSPAGPWLTSLATHDAYHCGQIIQIRKLQGSWPATRSFD